ncbi:uncharacterized protein PITG_10570 [Phytophthora infestans T30-4]|uniref:Uncharacterized protein n=1 Tax=Phytophthora infestans (strain T30-4) TaxID=403677 RepID=D0NFM6_PHYIT|nr:uncharacterized protein PITG_10570 [Phytophthora infestans T30-4]EEY57015.1 hypothetical protein PITG_10570 [Phytophthora infestans T30-4]|eukprot:XP_002902343.1 hypothetical protein PITG_10570 [Phytophthora infestans T30-4]
MGISSFASIMAKSAWPTSKEIRDEKEVGMSEVRAPWTASYAEIYPVVHHIEGTEANQ